MATPHQPRITAPRRRREGGVALIEGLISVVVLAVGILGLLKVSATLVQANTQSRDRVMATFFAEQLIGMALADPANAACYAVNSGTTCATTQTPVAQWLNQVTTLPGVSTTANQPVGTFTADGTFSITVFWQKPSEAGAHQYSATTNILN